ncbi:MAG: phosphoglycerate dehydrogenase [Gemmatimonadota bacterium]|nr:phosphoglycerate dehydrogenase [Gemmatimonadota bacterium]
MTFSRTPFRILVTDEVDQEGIALLQAVPEFRVDVVPTLPEAELLGRVGDYDAIVGRSATRISEPLLRAAKRLRVVGRAGVGVDNVDMDAATALGIAVINAPAGNTVAVAELFFAVLIGLLRHVTRADQSMHEGRWERSHLLGREIKGKTLGVVGVGRIGGEVSVRARAFGMTVIGYDPYIAQDRFDALQVRRCATLDELIAACDILTVHTPLTDETRGMIGARELAALRPGAVVCNLARGGIVDEQALADALVSGHLAGATVDAYTREPLRGDHPFRAAPHLLLTPHIGASTDQAQRNVAVDACAAVRDALLNDEYSRSLNVAESGGDWQALQPAMRLVRRSAAAARALLADRGARAISRVELRLGDELARGRGPLLASAALGALEGVVAEERLNVINARGVARSRGVELHYAEAGLPPHGRAVEVRVTADGQEARVGGVAAIDAPPRFTRIGSFHVDVAPRGTLIVLSNRDVPGVIGRVGTALGAAGVNIAEYHQARLAQGAEALAVITIDGTVSDEVRRTLLALPDVHSATVIPFGED